MAAASGKVAASNAIIERFLGKNPVPLLNLSPPIVAPEELADLIKRAFAIDDEDASPADQP